VPVAGWLRRIRLLQFSQPSRRRLRAHQENV